MSAALVPELAVSDWRASRAFYRDLLGFTVAYERPEEGFVYLERDGAEVMLDQIGAGRTFRDGQLDPPLGRGMNLQIRVGEIAPLVTALAAAGHRLFLPVEDRWYRAGDVETGNRQCIIADSDGYLLRFYEDLGSRPVRR